ncbi:DUF1905 domain-containing protein [Leptospira gomenensis]|uniref:DUF1905 domain-containing protein n=1 Tax=Leptospira gomenensis TaxID=2484974 RepID=A0A5F1YQ81_9LEPT|nr:DUF1905 domain-containing protein [Leptospira gomenensis]TGK27971.1 DUF1905 domain-containing protein [Leptospira gomenensis]TGK37174.1 DUF1905 domain-containing protein [Leptospira gomenensis]TGK45810.1 DUF1905 domain-containing protein [Leptospira gomenensis]TGK59749.1 DUF1905 domain-containing protein [Leptospira gomenensis]
MNSVTIRFTAKVWVYPGKGGWHFLTLSSAASKQVRSFVSKSSSWGMVSVVARIGDTVWQTSIFPEKNSPQYVLPLKADVRKKEKILPEQKVTASITIDF